MFGSRYIPNSDPAIPGKETCLSCHKDGVTLRCSKCKFAYFCNLDCQKKCWKDHKKDCKELASRSIDHMLPYTCRIIRYRDGAHVQNPEGVVQGRIATYRTEISKWYKMKKQFSLGTHVRSKSPIQKLGGFDSVLVEIFKFLKPIKRKVKVPKGSRYSDCAKDHIDVVNSLTPEQLNQKYPLACEERWGKRLGDHYWDENHADKGVPLYELLDDAEPPCCSADGSQFFSFCLNRPVNSDRVQHCEFCGKCFYFRPGCMNGCSYCGCGWNWHDKAVKFPPDARGCSVPADADLSTRGLAMEGYWGF